MYTEGIFDHVYEKALTNQKAQSISPPSIFFRSFLRSRFFVTDEMELRNAYASYLADRKKGTDNNE